MTSSPINSSSPGDGIRPIIGVSDNRFRAQEESIAALLLIWWKNVGCREKNSIHLIFNETVNDK